MNRTFMCLALLTLCQVVLVLLKAASPRSSVAGTMESSALETQLRDTDLEIRQTACRAPSRPGPAVHHADSGAAAVIIFHNFSAQHFFAARKSRH